jgi:hypothetical protein
MDAAASPAMHSEFQTLVEMTTSSASRRYDIIIAGKIGSPSASHNESGHCSGVYLELSEAPAPPFFAFLVSVEQFHRSQITQLHREINS